MIFAGSARSVPGFNLYEAVHACREHLIGYGGHFAAAGLSMCEDKLPDFIDSFEKIVAETIHEDLLIPEIPIDAELSFKEINFSFLNIIDRWSLLVPETCGPFLSRTMWGIPVIQEYVKEQHIRFVLQQDDKTFTGIGFNMADKFNLLEQKLPLDIVYTLDWNEWNGERMIQLKIIDFKQSAGALTSCKVRILKHLSVSFL